MTTSDQKFDKVRAILGKLDKSIDEARRRRLGHSEEPTPRVEPESPRPEPDSSDEPDQPSGFGRAQPLNRPSEPQGPNDSLERWVR